MEYYSARKINSVKCNNMDERSEKSHRRTNANDSTYEVFKGIELIETESRMIFSRVQEREKWEVAYQ